MTNPTISDDEFARYVKQVAMVTPEQVEAAEAEQRRQLASGITIPMGELLVRQGAINAVQREGVEKRLVAKQAGGLQQLGPYRIVRKLGEGGMGAVYLAEDTTASNRQVALKVLPKRSANEGEFVSRFRREARAAIGLNHPNIVAAYAVGEDFGVHWYAMEFCPGEGLDARLKRDGFLPWRSAVALAAQIAAGLGHAHAQGIAHRDIKPANVVISESGRAKILDFGLAKNLGAGGEQSFMTQTGVVMGTPHYISPEQARGDKDIDGRTDLYSLGATLYHLVTGHTPFSGNSPSAVLLKHLNDQLPDPREHRPDLPAHLVTVLRRLMVKQPAGRYPDAESLIADLERITTGAAPAPAADPGPSTVAHRRQAVGARAVDRRPLYVVIAVVALVLAGVGGSLLLRPAAKPAAPPVPPEIEALAASATRVPDLPAPSPTPSSVLASAPPVSVVAAPTPPPAVPAPTQPSVPAAAGQTIINLLPLIDPARDQVFGTWTRDGDALVSDGAGDWERGGARLAIAYRPPEEYDFHIVFTKRAGEQCVTQLFVANGQVFAWIMGGWGNRVFAFETVNGVDGGKPGNTTAVSRQSALVAGRRYDAVLRVRRGGTTALFNDAEISRTPANYRSMGSPGWYHLNTPAVLGLASWQTPTVFHVVEVVELSGAGRRLR